MNLGFEGFLDELLDAGWRPAHDENNGKIRMLWQSWQPDGYDASCIKVLTKEETDKRFAWVKSGNLAHKYKRDQKWVENGLEACRRSSVSPEYFIRGISLSTDDYLWRVAIGMSEAAA